jgi:hypothetical protein
VNKKWILILILVEGLKKTCSLSIYTKMLSTEGLTDSNALLSFPRSMSPKPSNQINNPRWPKANGLDPLLDFALCINEGVACTVFAKPSNFPTIVSQFRILRLLAAQDFRILRLGITKN